MVCLGDRLSAAEMFWEDGGSRTRDAEGLGLGLA